ncbi:thiamine pyrophosphate-dependent dehydrogenase E1 component subunit alpha [Tenggerimyces flavus]|uniref:Thiamine pyrophosphate-dependent dehydrogenase E1 component subunit alpha n=1 Tax=Tenggerimyces flavus TaxID=1708749 RepID=A0ABV7YJK6_9ACTN|nr:thiamine pyrophosphate-dependent dehydrogenase E1 component subunit alpha [Tenggerimyces flavus]MBM7789628.1 pyruvate dehydrogenase E1 component alpha subunit [Tenggerimyces flavus]
MATTNVTAVTEDLDPSVDELRSLYRQLVLIREFEQAALDLYARAQIFGIAHVSIGQEAVPVGVCSALGADDYITSTHRGHGHCLAKGADPGRMFAELFGRAAGYCGGKGGSMHIADPSTGNLGANAIVGGSLGIATGAALGAKLSGSGLVAVCFFGDGAANQGILLEVMNMAAIWSLPCVYVCEDNQYGEYTPKQAVTAGDLGDRAEALGVEVRRVDGMDVLAVRAAARGAVAKARAGEGPQFLLCETYRFLGHGMSDRDRRYRTRQEEAEWRARDPIAGAAEVLRSRHAMAVDEAAIRAEVADEIRQAIESARAEAFPDPEAVSRNVYAD